MGMKRATKEQAKLRMFLYGASGSGKTYSALQIAKHLGEKIGFFDTEKHSAVKYSDLFEFDCEEIVDDYNPRRLIEKLKKESKNYDVLVIDSLTHFWQDTPNCFLDLQEQEVKKVQARGGKADSFAAWKFITPLYNEFVQTILSLPCHIIQTARAAEEYSREGGKVTKVGMKPKFRDGYLYEMDVAGLIDAEHNLLIDKSRCPALDGKLFAKPGKQVADLLLAWLGTGVAPREVPSEPVSEVTPIVSDADALLANMKACTTLEELKAAVASATTANTEKRITAEEYKELGVVYLAVKKALAAA